MVIQKFYPDRYDQLASHDTGLRDVSSNANDAKAHKDSYNPQLCCAQPISILRAGTPLAASPIASTSTDRWKTLNDVCAKSMKITSLLRASPGHVRTRLFRDLVLLILLTVGLLVGVNVLLIDGLKRDLAVSRIETATAMVRDEIRGVLVPVEQQLLIIRDSLRAADLTPRQGKELNARFIPAMTHMPQIAGLIFADESGAEYFLRPDDSGWLSRQRRITKPATAAWHRWSDPDHSTLEREESLTYDPRIRPWFQLAEENAGEPGRWTAPYEFHSLMVAGMTASVGWTEDNLFRVVAIDVTLERILDAIDQLPVGPKGRGFLLSGSGGVYVRSTSDAGGEAEKVSTAFFSADDHLGGPLFFEAVAAWKSAGRPIDELVSFESEGRRWWGGFLPLADDGNAAWVGVALPVAETTGVLQSRWHVVAGAAVAIVGLGIGLVLLLVSKYSRQLRDMPKLTIDRNNEQQDLYHLINSGEGTHLELKSTMRTNLHTGRPGKEIELAWLKGAAAFLNTEGGILLVGVADDGTVLGLDADRFENEDKCRLHFKNLLQQHLGAEYARFLHFDLYDLEERRIAAIECERADSPVFLHHKNTEAFIIRNGPSNIELSISRALKYIQSRF